MKVGDAILFDGKGFFGSCIRFYNKINYHQRGWTHVGIITKVEKDRVLIHEALSKGFIKNYYEKWWIENKITDGEIKIISPKIKLLNVKYHADKYLGRPYAWFDIFGLVLSMLFGFKFLKITGSNKLICSEAVSRVVYDASNKKMNLAKEFKKSFDEITPTEISMSKYF